ncbi:MAG: heterodisulfide reductase-related iron-sulfur binding cluster [Myxococcota bacterium]
MPVAIGERVKSFLVYVLGQARVVSEPAGILHFFIFWGFLVLQLETIEYFIRGFYWKFHFSWIFGESLYNASLFVQDVIGFAVFVAITIAAFRRYVLRPKHSLPSADAAVILGLIGGLMVTKFIANGAEIAFMPVETLGHNPYWTPFALGTSYLLADGPASSIGSGSMWFFYNLGYWLHIGIVIFFLNYIPFGKHLHLLGAMPNVFFRKLEPVGALYPIDMNDESITKYGVSELEDLTWKQLLDTYACTECGRCEHYCPAYNTGKPLNPMSIVHNIKEHAREKGYLVHQKGYSPGDNLEGVDTYATELNGDIPSLVGGVITREEIWACTTCGACVGNCPVLIEHVDTILDMRRFLTMMESDLSPEVVRTFRNIENNSNPWGISSSYRGDWTEGLGIPHLRDLNGAPVDYLFFVGCAGSFDDRQKKVSQALGRILKEAGVSFAILGGEERCTGDPVRRLGNEYLYQTLAQQNVDTLNRYNVTRIITSCPHCFHTIGKEYPQLGGNYEVLHHTEVIADLLRTGRIKMSPGAGEKITYHDSCYIGRWAEIYDAPREIIDAIPGVTRSEMALSHKRSFCCGAGGGQMWMEEDLGKRVNIERTDQALETEPDMVAVACPFCMTMFDDGLKNRDADHVKLVDLAEIVDQHLITSPKSDETAPAEA